MDKPSGRARGGRDQFSWETIKSDKYRQNYLGHSLMAPIGKWQEGKDLIWYTKEKHNHDDKAVCDKQQGLQQEIAMVRQKEAELLNVQVKPASSTVNTLKKLELSSLKKQEKIKKQTTRHGVTDTERKENSKERNKRYRHHSRSRSKSPIYYSSRNYQYRSRHRSRSYDDNH